MKHNIKLKESDLVQIVNRILNEQDYSTDIDRPTSEREMDIKSVFGKKYGSYVPADVIRYMRKSPATIFKRLYEIYGDKAYEYLDKAKNSSEEITESHEQMNDRYMFFSNLEQIERQTGILRAIDEEEIYQILENGHDWAQDHIATAKESIDQVFDFLMNHIKDNDSSHDDMVMMESDVDEKWSKEYKKSIDCNNPKGFSQKAHCDARKKRQKGEETSSKSPFTESVLDEKAKKNKPTNPKLWQQCLQWARSRYKVCPSAYCNGAAVKRYNSKGGKWKKV